MGGVLIQYKRAHLSFAEFERALAIDTSLADAHGQMGIGKVATGHAEETEAEVNKALRLSPRDNNAFVWMLIAGTAKIYLGAHAEAVAWLRRSLEANRNLAHMHFLLAAALANLGSMEEARTEVQAGLALDPNFTVHRVLLSPLSDDPVYLKQRERLLEGMRKAGIPEQ